MTLTLLRAPRPDNSGHTTLTIVEFEVQNLSGSTLNFEAPTGGIYLELSTGKRYSTTNAQNPGFNDFRSGATKRFGVFFDVNYTNFETAIRDRNVTYYTVGVQRFNDRIPEAKWREEVAH